MKRNSTFRRVLQMHKVGVLISWSVFLLMASVFALRTAVSYYNDETRSTSLFSNAPSHTIENFMNSDKEAHPLWSYSTLYGDGDDRLQKYDAVLTNLYAKHAKFIWIEVGVMLFVPHLSMHKLFKSPTMRMVLRQQGGVLKQNSRMLASKSKRAIVAAAKTVRSIYKNRSKFSTLSDYTWYFSVDEKEKKPQIKGVAVTIKE